MSDYRIKVYVVSLIDSDRRAYITETLGKFNLPFEFFDAIHGATSTDPVLNHYDEKLRILRKNYPLQPGELGCFASHYLLWKKCVELNEPILILEDDARPALGFATILQNWDKLVAQQGIVKLFGGYIRKVKVVDVVNDEYKIAKSYKRTTSTAAYMLTPQAANQLLEQAKKWTDPVDDFLDSEWVHGVPVFCLEPYCFDRPNLETEINLGNKPKSPLHLKLRREILNIPRMLRELWYKIKVTLR